MTVLSTLPVSDVRTEYTVKLKMRFSNIIKEERKTLQNIRKGDNHMVLTADKGIALVIIDKVCILRNIWPYFNDEEVCHECRHQTKSIHSKVVTNNL